MIIRMRVVPEKDLQFGVTLTQLIKSQDYTHLDDHNLRAYDFYLV